MIKKFLNFASELLAMDCTNISSVIPETLDKPVISFDNPEKLAFYIFKNHQDKHLVIITDSEKIQNIVSNLNGVFSQGAKVGCILNGIPASEDFCKDILEAELRLTTADGDKHNIDKHLCDGIYSDKGGNIILEDKTVTPDNNTLFDYQNNIFGYIVTGLYTKDCIGSLNQVSGALPIRDKALLLKSLISEDKPFPKAENVLVFKTDEGDLSVIYNTSAEPSVASPLANIYELITGKPIVTDGSELLNDLTQANLPDYLVDDIAFEYEDVFFKRGKRKKTEHSRLINSINRLVLETEEM